jgi:hypothetical protein
MIRTKDGPLVCGLRSGTPHEPHGTCPGTAPEFLSEYVIPADEAATVTESRNQ